jgi:hypothetical protein
MRYLCFLRHSEKYRESAPPAGMMELHRKHWPGFDGESEVRPMYEPGMGPE